jgi:hypothetical protein
LNITCLSSALLAVAAHAHHLGMHTENTEPKPLMEMWPHSRTERLRVQLWPLSANVDVYDYEEHEWRRVATAHRNAETGPYDLSLMPAPARDLVRDAVSLMKQSERDDALRAQGIETESDRWCRMMEEDWERRRAATRSSR